MPLIDENGFILGRVNVIDLLVVVIVGALLVAGASFVMAGDGDGATRTIVLDASDEPVYVANALEEGAVPAPTVVAIDDIETDAANGSTDLTLTVTLDVTENADGLPEYDGERLYIGRNFSLDFGMAIVEGTVVEMGNE